LEGQERILQRYLKPDLLIIDDMGMKQLPKRSGEYLSVVELEKTIGAPMLNASACGISVLPQEYLELIW
jgi:hypothetical protein